MTETKQTAEERLAQGDRPLSLSECATLLNMRRPNVAKFLARRNVEPAFPKASGYFWWESDVKRVKEERESDPARMAADERRRESARRRAAGEVAPVEEPEEQVRLGKTQRDLMLTMLRRPVEQTDANRFSLLRLRKRGYCERIESGRWALTSEGRRVAAGIES
jgi:hypothetical protein